MPFRQTATTSRQATKSNRHPNRQPRRILFNRFYFQSTWADPSSLTIQTFTEQYLTKGNYGLYLPRLTTRTTKTQHNCNRLIPQLLMLRKCIPNQSSTSIRSEGAMASKWLRDRSRLLVTRIKLKLCKKFSVQIKATKNIETWQTLDKTDFWSQQLKKISQKLPVVSSSVVLSTAAEIWIKVLLIYQKPSSAITKMATNNSNQLKEEDQSECLHTKITIKREVTRFKTMLKKQY